MTNEELQKEMIAAMKAKDKVRLSIILQVKADVKNIEVKLYPSARHELLVELNREEVFADIGDWLERRL